MCLHTDGDGRYKRWEPRMNGLRGSRSPLDIFMYDGKADFIPPVGTLPSKGVDVPHM